MLVRKQVKVTKLNMLLHLCFEGWKREDSKRF